MKTLILPFFQKNYRNLILILSFFLFFNSRLVADICVSCPAGDITLTTQADVTNFASTHMNCTELLGNLIIGPSANIDNLDGLLGITKIAGGLFITSNPILDDVTGLGNLIEIGTGNIHITDNAILPSIDLSGASAPSLNDIYVYNNAAMTSLLLPTNIVTTAGYLQIGKNPLTTIPSFNSLTSVGTGSAVFAHHLIIKNPFILGILIIKSAHL